MNLCFFLPSLSAIWTDFLVDVQVRMRRTKQEWTKRLDDFTRQANRVIKLAVLDVRQAIDEAALVHNQAQTIEAFLKRHLSDEEELAVPIILHHRLRG